MGHFEIYVDEAGEYRWRLRADNEEPIADSAEGYTRREACQHGLDLVRQLAPAAEIQDLTDTKRSDLLPALKQAAAGLLYISETDAPFTPFLWEKKDFGVNGLMAATLLAHLGRTTDTPVEVVDIDDFFRNHTHPDEGGVTNEIDARRFRALVELLKQRLSDLAVYRVGRIEVDAYVVGKTAEDNFAGVSTRLVET